MELTQALGNFYLKTSVGNANKSEKNELYGFTGIAEILKLENILSHMRIDIINQMMT